MCRAKWNPIFYLLVQISTVTSGDSPEDVFTVDFNSWPSFFGFVQIQSGQLEALHSLLCSYHFLYANVRHGLLHHLLEIYNSYGERVWRYRVMFWFFVRVLDELIEIFLLFCRWQV